MKLDKIIKNVVDKHIRAITGINEEKLVKSLKEFIRIIQPVHQLGTIYTTGVGKSSYVAKKLASSISLLGIKSEYMCPVNALHGDIGKIDEESDILVVISNSGETQELITLLDNCWCDMKITGILSRNLNTIAKYCKNIFETGKIEESCVHNIIPTSSIVAQLTICDVIVSTLVDELALNREDLLESHPGGSIGKYV